MKQILLLSLIIIFSKLNASTTIVLHPDAASGKDAQVNDYGSNTSTNFGNAPVFASYIWTNGTVFTNKALLQFDFSSIPANATITSALLDLYADNPTTTFVGNPSTPMNGTNNASYIRRITQAWTENTVTWNNQPSVSNINQATLPTSNSATQNYIGVDITALTQDMLTLGNNGFLIEPVATSPSNSMVFRSSDYADSTYRPRLTVTYTVPQTSCITLRPDGSDGKDAQVNDYGSNTSTNYGSSPVFASYIWTNGTVFTNKALVQFNFSAIPANAVITSALLDLYADNPTTTFVGNPSTPMNGTNNASYIKRVTQAWTENGVTWNNQPSVTSTNQVTLPTSTTATQNYIGVGITQLAQDMLTLGNYGFMIEPVSSTPSNSMVFRSSDYTDSTYRPTLNICYSIGTAIPKVTESNIEATVFPNPFNDNFTILLKNNTEEIDVTVHNVMGQLFFKKKFDAQQNEIHISKTELNSVANILFVTINNGNKCRTFKLVTNQ